MRFWDVFVKWGTVLGILEKFNLRNLGISTINNKSVNCTYILAKPKIQFNLLTYIENRFAGNYIYVPDLVLDIALNLRLQIQQIHDLIIEQYKIYKEFISFERTSEIFVKKSDILSGDKIFFPKYNDSYISHLIIRKMTSIDFIEQIFNREGQDLKLDLDAKYASLNLKFNPFPRSGTTNINSSDLYNQKLIPVNDQVKSHIVEFISHALNDNHINKEDKFISGN